MKDLKNRDIDYMRISITDRCNLRCKYCMPNGAKFVSMNDILSYEEIMLIAKAATELGIHHIKITGGEPLVRKDVELLITMLKGIPGIDKVTLTTNGILLNEKLQQLMKAGLDGVNISLDTLDREEYAQITGYDMLDQVLLGIEKTVMYDIPVKINVVSLLTTDWQRMIGLAKKWPVDVRFIEMMPIGYGKQFPALDHGELLKQVQNAYPDIIKDERKHGFGPAVYFKIPEFQGSIGFISAIHGKFCDECNRIRLTSQGYLKACLCYEDGMDLRSIIRAREPEDIVFEKVKEAMKETILHKPDMHCFENPKAMTEQKNMVSIGG